MKPGNRLLHAAPFAAVVALLAAGIAVIAPRISRGARQSNDAMLCEALRYLRTEIRVYTDEHHDVAPGYAAVDVQTSPDRERLASVDDAIPIPAPAATADVFLHQLTQFTDVAGHISSARSEACDHGPYIIALPQNPITLKSAVLVVDQADMAAVEESKPYGWIYNARTRQLIANISGVDSSGVPYASY